MKIELKTIKIRDLVKDYKDDEEAGVTGYGGLLDIRPPYQREFVYDLKQEEMVIDTITKGFPLNTMYWVVRQDGRYEVLDGQQRTISICKYYSGKFPYMLRFYGNLQPDEKEKFLNYELQVYFCEGTDIEKLEWFKTINIAGEKLSDQEIRNAIYAGSWTLSAKKIFSRNGCAALKLSEKYVTSKWNRQELLEKAIGWYAGDNDKNISTYMGLHQDDENADELWTYFQKVIAWVKMIFPNHRTVMKSGIEWGDLYNQYHDKDYSPTKFEEEIDSCMKNEEVQNKRGIYHYVFDHNDKWLNLRTFDESDKRTKYEQQNGICQRCHEHFEYEEMEGDHIVAWHKGGKTTFENLQMLCVNCNRSKSGK